MMNSPAKKETKDTGLRGVLVADTSISMIDAEKGELSYRGFDIHDLASYSTSEEVAHLLLYGTLPTPAELESFTRMLAVDAHLPAALTNLLKNTPRSAKPMDVLQSAVASLAYFDPELANESKEADQKRAVKLIAKLPTIVAAWDRIRRDLAPIAPNSNLSRAANFLYMLTGELPDEQTARDLDTCLVLHSEHSFNASTFTARVVTSTRAHMYAAVSAAVGALSGELHGGANAQVMRNLEEIGEVANVEAYVKAEFDRHERVMGMGHAIYKALDPRAELLRHLAEGLARRTGVPKWYLITRQIEEVTQKEFKKRKGGEIYPNVDLYSASVYHMMGIPADLFTPVFASARISGWTAHILEEKFPAPPIKPVLYRPRAEYVGNYCGEIGCKYVPLRKRGTAAVLPK
ncbi:MAG TPA: citrate/2-methylcitrate synthase [Candidatus Nanoarchaeia archaeon]|nr:citrate/2-methylcitrate synthase [Candidatus Nanoarchaeia archaeon]